MPSTLHVSIFRLTKFLLLLWCSFESRRTPVRIYQAEAEKGAREATKVGASSDIYSHLGRLLNLDYVLIYELLKFNM